MNEITLVNSIIQMKHSGFLDLIRPCTSKVEVSSCCHPWEISFVEETYSLAQVYGRRKHQLEYVRQRHRTSGELAQRLPCRLPVDWPQLARQQLVRAPLHNSLLPLPTHLAARLGTS
eukprot:COSAG03_NODE_9459_length_718_cov_1.163166_1_plen_116_part_01